MAQEHVLWKSLLTDWHLLDFEDAFKTNGWDHPIDWKHIDDSELNAMGLKSGHKVRFYRRLKQWIQKEERKNNIQIKQEPISDNSDVEIIGVSHPSSRNNNAANLRNVNNSNNSSTNSNSAVPLDNKNPLADLVVNINNNNNGNNNNQQIDIEPQNHLNQPQNNINNINNINDSNETTESENNESEHNNSNYISNMNRNDSDHPLLQPSIIEHAHVPSYNEISPQTFTQDTDISASVHSIANDNVNLNDAINNLFNQDMDIPSNISIRHSDDDNIDNINNVIDNIILPNKKMKKRKWRVVSESDVSTTSDSSDFSVSQSSSISQYSSSEEQMRSVRKKSSYCYGCNKKFDTQTRKDRHNCTQYPIDINKYISSSPSPSPPKASTTTKKCIYCNKIFKNGSALGGHLSRSRICGPKAKNSNYKSNHNHKNISNNTNNYCTRSTNNIDKKTKSIASKHTNNYCIESADESDKKTKKSKKHTHKNKKSKKHNNRRKHSKYIRKKICKNKDGSIRAPHLTLDEALRDTASQSKWSQARREAWEGKDSNPEKYYYRFNDTEQHTTKGMWSQQEEYLFIKRAREFGVNASWGIFSKAIPGRVGYICSNQWRKMIKNRKVKDQNYYYNPNKKDDVNGKSKRVWFFKWGKAHNKCKGNKTDGVLKQAKRFSFAVYDNEREMYIKHPKHADFEKIEEKYKMNLSEEYYLSKFKERKPKPKPKVRSKSKRNRSHEPSKKRRRES